MLFLLLILLQIMYLMILIIIKNLDSYLVFVCNSDSMNDKKKDS